MTIGAWVLCSNVNMRVNGIQCVIPVGTEISKEASEE